MHTNNPMTVVQNVYSLTLNDELDHARRDSPAWFAEFEDSALSVPGAADLSECADLAARAPTPTLRGYVLGMLINN